jgi:hypothetical protein
MNSTTVTTTGTSYPYTLSPGTGTVLTNPYQQYPQVIPPVRVSTPLLPEDERFMTHLGYPLALVINREEELYSMILEDPFTNLVVALSTGKFYHFQSELNEVNLHGGHWAWVIIKDGKLEVQELILTPEEQAERLKVQNLPEQEEKLKAFKLELNQKQEPDIKQEINGFQGSLDDPFTQVE